MFGNCFKYFHLILGTFSLRKMSCRPFPLLHEQQINNICLLLTEDERTKKKRISLLHLGYAEVRVIYHKNFSHVHNVISILPSAWATIEKYGINSEISYNCSDCSTLKTSGQIELKNKFSVLILSGTVLNATAATSHGSLGN